MPKEQNARTSANWVGVKLRPSTRRSTQHARPSAS